MDVTYEQLFDILRREKSRDELQQLDPLFYEGVRSFLAAKEDTISTHGLQTLAAQRAQIELQNAKKIIKELFERRERKIITMALHQTRTDGVVVDQSALLQVEHSFLESLVHLMLQQREQVLSGVEMRPALVITPFQQYRPPSSFERDASAVQSSSDEDDVGPARSDEVIEEAAGDTFTHEELLVSVRFLAPVPKFVGKDLRVFGPFEQGEQAELPDEIAQILIRKGRAQELDP